MSRLEDIFEQELSGLLSDSLRHDVIRDKSGIKAIHDAFPELDDELFGDICDLYGYPITVIHELSYTDKMYRDAYYTYYSRLHFDMPRECHRLALFQGSVPLSHFFDNDYHESLSEMLLGTIVIMPTYNSATRTSFGRTLLDPTKMRMKLRYLRTAEFKVTICGRKYLINAFPFSNQMGDVLRCAETSVWALLEYFGTKYETYRTILPSTIIKWESEDMVQRSLPSEGMTYLQISAMLKDFGFEPLIYERESYQRDGNLASGEREDIRSHNEKIVHADPTPDVCSMQAASVGGKGDFLLIREKEAAAKDAIIAKKFREKQGTHVEKQEISLRSLFHYYIESGIPLITAVCNERESVNHSIIVIGHDERSPYRVAPGFVEQNVYKLGDLNCIDSSTFYDRYITIDDNQYPYRSELFDRFSVTQNCKVKAFIVPLYRHIFLTAEAAVKIIEAYVREFADIIGKTTSLLAEKYSQYNAQSIGNPIVMRYFLTASRSFTDFRSRNTDYYSEKVFYSRVPYPKFIWTGELSTFELYQEGLVFGEIVLDATAPFYSGSGAVISMRISGRCASRNKGEKQDAIKRGFIEGEGHAPQASVIFKQYTSNLQKGDFGC